MRNLLLNEKNELFNRNLHIKEPLKMEKVDIETEKVDIHSKKVDIENLLFVKTAGFSTKTVNHIRRMFDQFVF